MTSPDTTELMLAVLLGILALHTILGAGAAGLGASFGLDLSTKSHWARPATVLTIITAAAALVVLAVRLGVLINDAGGYDSNNDNHNATLLGIIAVPLAVVTAVVALCVATRRQADGDDFLNRNLTAWTLGILAVAVLAGPALVLLAFFPL